MSTHRWSSLNLSNKNQNGNIGITRTREKIEKLINQVFVEQFELNEADLTAEKGLFDDLMLDSLDMVDLITGLQRKFAIPLRDNPQVRQIRKLGDIYDLFEKLAAENRDDLDFILNRKRNKILEEKNKKI